MEMGMISGRDILSMVRHSESKTPVVVMTAMGKFDVATAEAEGFDGYLQKPFSINGLKDLIAGKSSHPPVEAKSPNHPFPRLHEMFDGDMEAITEVLNSFAVASEKNLLLLNEAVINDQFAAAQAICHKMLPMFIQLGLDEQVPFLQKMDGLRGKSPDEFPEWKSETSACIVSAETIVSQMKLKSDAV
jgi:CheY-like chemotaxis protein